MLTAIYISVVLISAYVVARGRIFGRWGFTVVIHGAKDQRFPVDFALRLKSCFSPERSDLFIAEKARHSESSFDPKYEAAVRGFIARHLDPAGEDKRNP